MQAGGIRARRKRRRFHVNLCGRNGAADHGKTDVDMFEPRSALAQARMEVELGRGNDEGGEAVEH